MATVPTTITAAARGITRTLAGYVIVVIRLILGCCCNENRLLITDFENLSDTQLREYTSKGKYHAKGENE